MTVGSGAKILGSFEVGDNCSVAANAVLLRPLEENTTAVGIPGASGQEGRRGAAEEAEDDHR